MDCAYLWRELLVHKRGAKIIGFCPLFSYKKFTACYQSFIIDQLPQQALGNDQAERINGGASITPRP